MSEGDSQSGTGTGNLPRDVRARCDGQLDNAKGVACARCGQLIPAYAEGVCPRCQQTRKILWRLLDVAKPYRRELRSALVLTLLFAGVAILSPILTRYLIDNAVAPKVMNQTTQQMVF